MPDHLPDPEIARLVRDLDRSARGEVRREEGPGQDDLEARPASRPAFDPAIEPPRPFGSGGWDR